MENNPYQAPQAILADDKQVNLEGLIPNGQAVSVGSAFTWIGEAWSIFASAPLIWVINLIIFVVILVVASFVPLLNIFSVFLTTILLAGWYLSARMVDDGESIGVENFFDGFKYHFNNLLIVGAINFGLQIVLTIFIVILAFVVIGGALFAGGATGLEHAFAGGLGIGVVLAGILVLAGIMLVISATYFAPALVIFNEVSPIEAIKMSFLGYWKNFFPLLVFSIVAVLLLLVSAIPFGLGLLVTIPLLFISNYVAYKRIFLAD